MRHCMTCRNTFVVTFFWFFGNKNCHNICCNILNINLVIYRLIRAYINIIHILSTLPLWIGMPWSMLVYAWSVRYFKMSQTIFKCYIKYCNIFSSLGWKTVTTCSGSCNHKSSLHVFFGKCRQNFRLVPPRSLARPLLPVPGSVSCFDHFGTVVWKV